MDRDEIEYEVANGGRITLPALNEEDKEFGMTAEIALGVLLQPLDDQTARALLVIDDEHAYGRCSSPTNTGYTLYIDHATMVRPRST